MKKITTDIIEFIGALSTNDIIFFTSVMALLILVVTMVYLIKLGREEFEAEKKLEKMEDFKDELLTELLPQSIEDVLPKADDEPEQLLDLATLTKNLQEAESDYSINLNRYEEEQEEKAIISYEELIKTNSAVKINYESITEDEGISVKKVNLDNLTTSDESVDTQLSIHNYEKEEAFLQAIKDLQKLLS